MSKTYEQEAKEAIDNVLISNLGHGTSLGMKLNKETAPNLVERLLFKEQNERAFWHCFRFGIMYVENKDARMHINVVHCILPEIMYKYECSEEEFESILNEKDVYLAEFFLCRMNKE